MNSAIAEHERLVLRVGCNGIGVDAHVIPRMFETFAQSIHAIARSGGDPGRLCVPVKDFDLQSWNQLMWVGRQGSTYDKSTRGDDCDCGGALCDAVVGCDDKRACATRADDAGPQRIRDRAPEHWGQVSSSINTGSWFNIFWAATRPCVVLCEVFHCYSSDFAGRARAIALRPLGPAVSRCAQYALTTG